MKFKKFFTRIYGYFSELGRLTPIAFVNTFLPFAGSAILISVAYPLGTWLKENWEMGSGLYVASIVIICGLSLLPTNVIGLIGGWAFGLDLGIALLISGVCGAAMLSFFLHSRIAGDRLRYVFEHHSKAKVIYRALLGGNNRRTTLIIFLIRLSPAMPFALTNFLMASARVPLKSFLVGTFFGMLPRSSAVVFVGSGLSELRLDSPEESWLIVFGIAATLVTVFVISFISQRALAHLTQEST